MANWSYRPEALRASGGSELRLQRAAAKPEAPPPGVPSMSLRQFLREAWPSVEPGRTFVPGWHLDAIADHLEWAARGEIRRLMINIPPRHTKSTLVGVIWPAWIWTFRPEAWVLSASYALGLAVRDSLRCKRLVQSAWYRERWPSVVLKQDQKAKGRWELDPAGGRIATSVDGSATGEGGDVLVLDDPHNVREALSDPSREGVLDWYSQVWSTRKNDEATAIEALIMQRVHQADLCGWLLQEFPGEWEHLMLPARFEAERASVTHRTPALATAPIEVQADPRKKDGELLWPARMGQEQLTRLERQLGTFGAAGQLQQRPAPAGGGLFKIQWWQRAPAEVLAGITPLFTYVDTAAKTGVHNDFSVLGTFGMLKNDFYLLDLVRGRWEYPDLRRMALNVHARHQTPLVIEDSSAGMALIQDLKAGGLPVVPWKAGNQTKLARASVAAAFVEAKRVWLPEQADWVAGWIEEHAQFPNGLHDDCVDVSAMAMSHLPRMADFGSTLVALFERPAIIRAPIPHRRQRPAVIGIRPGRRWVG